MNTGKYIYSQFVEFLPKRVFDGILEKYNVKTCKYMEN